MKECAACRTCFADEVEVCDKDNQPARLTLRIDNIINGRYQLIRRVGNSSVSVVYFAIDLLSQTEHAVKIILPEFIGEDRRTAERFISEATAPSVLSHPNIVRITDSGLLTGFLPFLVMDFIKGSSLHEAISNGPIAPMPALEYISTIGKALDAAHQRQIVHGDLKPRSILIEDDRPVPDAIRITDFGLSTIKSGKLQGSVAAKSSGVLRSPLYLAPEEFSEEASDHRSDIYSLGIILYEMLAGDVPFRGKSIPSIMKRHLLDTPAPIAGRSPEVTAEIEQVVMHALEKDPTRRPRSMIEFVAEFEHAVRANENPAGKESLLPDSVDEAIAVDLNQTIVLAKPLRSSPTTQYKEDKADRTNESFIQREKLLRPGEHDFDATIVPGMMKFEMVENNVSSAAVDDQIETVWEESPEPEDESTEMSEEDPVQRSVSPMLLATGVLVFILLIALGIYYTRSLQSP
jgi:serine/threonine-protein kinase